MEYKELIVEDPENGKTYKWFLNETDYKRAHEDMHFVSALLQSANENIQAGPSKENDNEDDDDMHVVSALVNSAKENIQSDPSTEFYKKSQAGPSTESYKENQPTKLSIDNLNESEKHIWNHRESMALINSMQSHHEDLSHAKKRKHVFENISNELLSLGFTATPIQCQTKWKSLVRTYTTTKDNKNKTGRGPSRFQFFEEIDHILGKKPSNQCEHSLESDSTRDIEGGSTSISLDSTSSKELITHRINNEEATEGENRKENKKSEGTPSKIKKRKRNMKYCEEKKKKEEEKQARHKERMEVEREKMDLEKEKLALFKEYLKLRK